MTSKLSELITETTSCFDKIKSENKPIYLYGKGNGADKIVCRCLEYGIKISGVFANDDRVRPGDSYYGFPILKLSDIEAMGKDFACVLAYGNNRPDVLAQIRDTARRHTLYAPSFPVFGRKEFNSNTYINNEHLFQEVYSLLADDFSRQLYADVINFQISGNIKYLDRTESTKYDIYNILKLTERETYFDIGAYDGDSVMDFITHTSGIYNKIIAFEPDPKNFRKLQRAIDGIANVTAFEFASSSEDTTLLFTKEGGRQAAICSVHHPGAKYVTVRSIDSFIAEHQIAPTYIKMDVEGEELDTIWGASDTIRDFKPKLAVSLYHKLEDLYHLPHIINMINPDYKFYLRRLPYIPAWDMCLYCI